MRSKQLNEEENQRIGDLQDENAQLVQRIQELERDFKKLSENNKSKLLSLKNILAQLNSSINKKEEEILRYSKAESDHVRQIESLK